MDGVIEIFGIQMNPSKVAFTLFGREIHWYGIIIALAFLVAAFYVTRRAPRFGISGDDVIDALLFAVPVAIIFARLYYVLFNLQEFTRPDGEKVWEIWNGGIAIYGALIGGVLTIFVISLVRKKRKLNFLAFMDLAAPGLLIGQCIGRWGNFINREAFGTATSLPWAMSIGGGNGVHPTFLYESLWCLAGFFVLHYLFSKRKFNGQVVLMYAAWYGFGRSFIEGLRSDALMLGETGLRVSQVLSVILCLASLVLLAYHLLYKKHNPAEELLPPLPVRVRGAEGAVALNLEAADTAAQAVPKEGEQAEAVDTADAEDTAEAVDKAEPGRSDNPEEEYAPEGRSTTDDAAGR